MTTDLKGKYSFPDRLKSVKALKSIVWISGKRSILRVESTEKPHVTASSLSYLKKLVGYKLCLPFRL